MKGIELPINILIIIAVAVIVLIAIVAMFYPAFASGSKTVSLDVAKGNVCKALTSPGNDCRGWPAAFSVYSFDANKDGTTNPGVGDGGASCNTGATSADNLWSFCVCQLQIPETAAGCGQCKALCGCQYTSCP